MSSDSKPDLKRIGILILFLSIAFMGTVNGQDSKPKKHVVYAGDHNYPPFEYLDENGEPAGFHIDLLRAIAKEKNWDVEFQLDTWHEVYYDFKTDTGIDISDFFYNVTRDEWVDYSDPVSILYHEIVVRKTYPVMASYEDLIGKKVVVQKNSFLEDYLRQNFRGIEIVTVNSEPEALQVLARGDYDCAIVSHFIVQILLTQPEYQNLTTTASPMLPRELSFVVHPGDSLLLNDINEGMEILKAKGKFNEIYNKWFAVPSINPLSWQNIVKWVFAILAILLLVGLVVTFWIISLRKAVARKTMQLNQELEARHKANLKLREREILLRDAQFLAGMGSWSYDPQTDTMAWYDDLANVTCYQIGDKVQIKPSQYLKAIHEDDRSKFMEVFENAKSGRVYKSFEFKSYNLDKEVVYLSMSTHPLYDENNNLIKVVGVIQDITERYLNEIELKEKNEELVKINQELDRFVYSLSHDIKAPIASVSGLVSIMKIDVKDPNAEIYISKIEESIAKLQLFINDILNYSRNVRVKVATEPVDFEKIVDSTYELLHYLKGAEKIQLIKNIHLDSTFYSDNYRIKVLFNNIFSNAIKYYDPAKETSFIQVKIESNAEQAIIKVKDNGIGISKDHQNRIFEMFYRATEQATGAGLGLYIVKEVVEKLKGEIHLDAQEGEWTEVTVILPNLADEHRNAA